MRGQFRPPTEQLDHASQPPRPTTQERAMRKIALTVLAVLALAGCTVPQTPTVDPPTASESSAPSIDVSVTPTPTQPAVPSATPAAAPAKRIRVPNVVGVNHQTAQDTMQAAGLFMLQEEDATGASRMLLYDRNWVVVRQSPRAGTKVSADTTVTLFSKKIGE
jgi:hypothetical protein